MYCVSGHYIHVEAVVVEAVAVYSTSNVKTFLVATTKHFSQKKTAYNMTLLLTSSAAVTQ